LPAGTRTPLFAIRAKNRRFDRLEWFLRLASVLPGESDLHGLVRLEVTESLGAAGACLLADRAEGFGVVFVAGVVWFVIGRRAILGRARRCT
jgi:hypothetical protein